MTVIKRLAFNHGEQGENMFIPLGLVVYIRISICSDESVFVFVYIEQDRIPPPPPQMNRNHSQIYAHDCGSCSKYQIS